MIKKMCCLGSAILGVIGLSACGSTTPVALDKSILSTGDSNAITSGGYWWTYTDHNDPSIAANAPYHATIDQLTSATNGLKPTVDSDPKHGNVIQVAGKVPTALPWADVSASPQAAYTIDPHWASVYPDATVPDYPSAGVGFGYQHFNKPFDATGGDQKYVGIVFDMKATVDNMPTVWVTMPMVGTDLPDPSVGITDDFPAPGQDGGCKYYTLTNTPAGGGMSCFTSYRKGIKSAAQGGGTYNLLGALNVWEHYCVLFSEVQPPNWANAASRLLIPAFNPKLALKVQWDFFQPAEASRSGVETAYGIALDNVKLITAEEAGNASNNCDQARLDDPYGSGDAG